jgi:hypothetical protein
MGGGEVVAIMRLRESEVVEDFRLAGATTPTGARSLADIGTGESGAFERLCEREVIRQPTPGCYYLDEEAWNAIRTNRSRLGIVLVVTLLLVAAAAAFWIVTTR